MQVSGSCCGRSELASLRKAQCVSELATMVATMGAASRPPQPPPSVQQPMSALPQLCGYVTPTPVGDRPGSVTPTSVGDRPNADMRESSQKPSSALPRPCRSVTPTSVGDRPGSVTHKLVGDRPNAYMGKGRIA